MEIRGLLDQVQRHAQGNTPGKIWVRVAAKGADDQPGASSDPAEDLVR